MDAARPRAYKRTWVIDVTGWICQVELVLRYLADAFLVLWRAWAADTCDGHAAVSLSCYIAQVHNLLEDVTWCAYS